ncbi:MAG: hypothetical protein ACREBT_02410 [Thermoplasmata archaeon]
MEVPVEASAFAPGHVTGIFRPAAGGRDPRSVGSIGAGVVLSLGAHASVRWLTTAPRRVRVVGDGFAPLPITEDAVRRLVAGHPGRFEVRLHHELPIGQGFGMSAAGTLAASLAVAHLVGATRARAVEIAHLAELFGGGGLGGVAAILGGGLEVRDRPGIPPFGRVRHLGAPGSIWLGVVGPPTPSPALLRDPAFRRRVERSARLLDPLLASPSFARFFRASERFADALGFGSAGLRATLRGLRSRGAWAAPAMFGESFFAVAREATARERMATWLRARGIPAIEVRPARTGARRTRSATGPSLRRVRKDFRGGRARRRP